LRNKEVSVAKRKKKKPPIAAGKRTKIVKDVPTPCGSEPRGANVRVVDTYESQDKGGEEHAIVQLEETGAVVGVPTKALQRSGKTFGFPGFKGFSKKRRG
jgi:hypothetical protein